MEGTNGTKLEAEKVERDLKNMSQEHACFPTRRPWRRSAATRHISPEASTRPSTSLRPCRSGARVALLPWPGWTWTDWRRAKGRAFTQLLERVFYEVSLLPIL